MTICDSVNNYLTSYPKKIKKGALAVKNYAISYPKRIKDRALTATGMVAVAMPLNALLEVGVAGMSDSVSGYSRVASGIFTYLITPGALDGIEYSREYFNATKSYKKIIHDGLLFFAIGGAYRFGAYVAAGESNLAKVAWGTFLTSLGSAVAGPILLGSGKVFDKAYSNKYLSLKPVQKNINRLASAAILSGSIIAASSIYNNDWAAQEKQEVELDKQIKIEAEIKPETQENTYFLPSYSF